MNHLLRVDRYGFNLDNTISRFYIQDKLFSFGIEDEKRKIKVHGETCIDDGTYKLGTRYSPKFSKFFYTCDGINLITKKQYLGLHPAVQKLYKPHDLIWIMETPKFQYVLIHWGNTDDDTDGCYIIGNKLGIIGGQEAVLDSRNTYMKFYPQVIQQIKAGGQTIQYRSI